MTETLIQRQQARVFPLAFASEGETVEVVSVSGGKGLVRKLYSMGIVPGAVLRVVKSEPPGPMIVEIVSTAGSRGACPACPLRFMCPGCPVVSGTRIALGHGVALKVYVRKVG